MPKDRKTLGNSKARACESLGFVHKKGCARVLTQPLSQKQFLFRLFFQKTTKLLPMPILHILQSNDCLHLLTPNRSFTNH